MGVSCGGAMGGRRGMWHGAGRGGVEGGVLRAEELHLHKSRDA